MSASSACAVTVGAASPVNVSPNGTIRCQPNDLVTVAPQSTVGMVNWRLRIVQSDSGALPAPSVLTYQTSGFSVQIPAPNEPCGITFQSQADDKTGAPAPFQFTLIVGKPMVFSEPQGSSASAVGETILTPLIGTGTLFAAYFVPFANSQPASGSNNQVLTLKIYDASGNLVGTLASATLANATAMTKGQRFSLGALSNVNWQDGYTVTYQTALTGTATLPAGQWLLVGMGN